MVNQFLNCIGLISILTNSCFSMDFQGFEMNDQLYKGNKVIASIEYKYPPTSLEEHPTCYKRAIVHNPEAIQQYKKYFKDIPFLKRATTIPFDQGDIYGNQEIRVFRTMDFGFFKKDEEYPKYLLAPQAYDCVIVVAFNVKETYINHVYRTSVGGSSDPGDEEDTFNKRDIPEFYEHFKNEAPKIYLFSSYYTPHLLKIKQSFEENGFEIEGFNILDIVEGDKESTESRSLEIFYADENSLDKKSLDILKGNKIGTKKISIPGTHVAIEVKTNTIYVERK